MISEKITSQQAIDLENKDFVHPKNSELVKWS